MQTSRLRISSPRNPFFDSLDREIANAVDAAIAVLRKMTASVEEVALPATAIQLDQIFLDVRSVEVYAYHSQWLSESPENINQVLANGLVENAADVKPTDYAQSRR